MERRLMRELQAERTLCARCRGDARDKQRVVNGYGSWPSCGQVICLRPSPTKSP
jgi:hypothetical protein